MERILGGSPYSYQDMSSEEMSPEEEKKVDEEYKRRPDESSYSKAAARALEPERFEEIFGKRKSANTDTRKATISKHKANRPSRRFLAVRSVRCFDDVAASRPEIPFSEEDREPVDELAGYKNGVSPYDRVRAAAKGESED